LEDKRVVVDGQEEATEKLEDHCYLPLVAGLESCCESSVATEKGGYVVAGVKFDERPLAEEEECAQKDRGGEDSSNCSQMSNSIQTVARAYSDHRERLEVAETVVVELCSLVVET
jgi:hypothetical protein